LPADSTKEITGGKISVRPCKAQGWGPVGPVYCTTAKPAVGGAIGRDSGKLLGTSTPVRSRPPWHTLSKTGAMIPLLLAFFALAALLCLLVGADDPAGADPGVAAPDPLELWRAAPLPDRAKPGGTAASGRTASGLAGGQ